MNDHNYILFTVIIPVYNGSKYLKETLNSFLNQSYRNFEIIAIDDGSTDNSFEILQSYSSGDIRIKIFQKQNEGTAAKSVKFGLQYASGEYFMYSSQDDLISKDFFEKASKRVLETNADAIVPDMLYFPESKEYKKGIIGVNGDRSLTLSGREAASLSLDYTISGFVLWKIALVNKVGYYDYGINSDEYTVRVLYFNCSSVSFFDGIFYYRQNNPDAITKKWSIKFLDFLETTKRLEQFALANQFPCSDIEKLHRQLFRGLLNINRSFLLNKRRIATIERIDYQKRIRTAYTEHFKAIESIKPAGLKEMIILSFTGLDFKTFNLYSKLTLMYLYCLRKINA